MSKWILLKKAINSISDANNSDDISIHRFKGFELVKKKLVSAVKFKLDLILQIVTEESIYDLILTMEKVYSQYDCFQIFFNIILETCHDRKLFQDIFTNIILLPSDYQFTIFNISEDADCNNVLVECYHKFYVPLFRKRHYLVHSVRYPSSSYETIDNPSIIRVMTRENSSSRVELKGLLSDRFHGIDNTGNIRVWPSEHILLYTMLHNFNMMNLIRNKRVLELGGGMTALCGLALAACGLSQSVLLTDGHPDCVRNQTFCINLNKYNNIITSEIDVKSQLLRWSVDDSYGDIASVTNCDARFFDVIIACDVLFFRDFHEALLYTLRKTLIPDGIILLLQPRRGETMNEFLVLAQKWFTVEIQDNYDVEITRMRQMYQVNNQNMSTGHYYYDEDIHYPVLVTLRFNKKLTDEMHI